MTKDKAGPASATHTDDSDRNPGDEARRGTPGTGENVCPVCHGSKTVNDRPCSNCGGTGVVIEGVGGA